MKSITLVVTLGGLVGCLPKDSRPPPAEVLVQASSDDAITQGFDTSDGWHLEFTRFLMTIGRASIDGDACTSYSEGNYERILDLQQPSPQKVSLMYGLGRCDFSFGVVHPVSDSVVGLGVTQDEALSMRTAGSDLYTAFSGQLTGIDTLVSGTASRGDVIKSFNWAFRLDYYFQKCSTETDSAGLTNLNLQGQRTTVVDLVVHGERLFMGNADVSAQSQFDAFAAADSPLGNDDGQITLEELAEVPVVAFEGGLADAGTPPPSFNADAGVLSLNLDGGLPTLDASVGHVPTALPTSLGDYVYYSLYPTLVRYQGVGRCTATITRPRRGP